MARSTLAGKQMLRNEFLQLFKKSGWSQKETAGKLGVSQNYINMIITAGRAPSERLIASFKFKLLPGIDTGTSWHSLEWQFRTLAPEKQDLALRLCLAVLRTLAS